MYWVLWLCTLALSCSSRAECPITATGVCTPGVEETIVITETESIEYEADGHTVTTTTTTDTTTVTITNEDSGDILDGDNGFVASKYEGDMDIAMEHLMAQRDSNYKEAPRILEINGDHSLIKNMKSLLG